MDAQGVAHEDKVATVVDRTPHTMDELLSWAAARDNVMEGLDLGQSIAIALGGWCTWQFRQIVARGILIRVLLGGEDGSTLVIDVDVLRSVN
jgi:hypothetical protein